jgi:SAM-dependent methyltransferase
MKVLHLGCGRKKLPASELFAYVGLNNMPADADVVHLDADHRLEPDVVCRLGDDHIPMDDDSVDVAIAWHVLEHIGRQGETDGWFTFWEDLYRVLKPNGWLYAECPYHSSVWAWADPTHTRAISEHALVFFNQDSYRIHGSMISPYRIQCDFQPMGMDGMPKGFARVKDDVDRQVESIRFAMHAKKPLMPWWEN